MFRKASMALALPQQCIGQIHISLYFFYCTICHHLAFVTFTHSYPHPHTHTHRPYFPSILQLTQTHTHAHTHKQTERSIVWLHCKSMSLLSPRWCLWNCIYSTVTDLAKFLGQSTYKKKKEAPNDMRSMTVAC